MILIQRYKHIYIYIYINIYIYIYILTTNIVLKYNNIVNTLLLRLETK